MLTELLSDIAAALAGNAPAQAAYDKLPPSHRREYLQWVAEAKKPETRARRIAQMLERLQK